LKLRHIKDDCLIFELFVLNIARYIYQSHPTSISVLFTLPVLFILVIILVIKYTNKLYTITIIATTTITIITTVNSVMDLPFWLARSLHKSVVETDLPKHYGLRMRSEIKAGAKAIRFRDYSKYYFETGVLLAHLIDDNGLLEAFRKAFAGDRYRDLTARALSGGGNVNDDVNKNDNSQTLINAELQILNAGLESSRELMRWKEGESTAIRSASIIQKHRSNGNSEGAGNSKKQRMR